MRTIGALVVLVVLCSFALAAGPPRVFITDSKSWEVSGGFGGTSGGFGGASSGGARPQTAEIIKTFGERCPEVVVTMRQEKADYVVILDHEGGKSILVKDNKVAVFDNHEGDSIFSRSTAILGNSVKDACQAITRHWAQKGRAEAEADSAKALAATATPASAGTALEVSGAKVQLTSTPSGADIEVDGAFMGTTPSTIAMAPGDHAVILKKSGYQPWVKTLKVTGGDVSLSAELAKVPAGPGQQQ